jgi:hypothetical protein
MSDFIFRVDDFHLTEQQQKQVAAAIRNAAAGELAKMDLSKTATGAATPAATPAATGSGGSFLFAPLRWNGGRMLPAVLAVVENAENQTLAVTVQTQARA